jgi:hypothetical protein
MIKWVVIFNDDGVIEDVYVYDEEKYKEAKEKQLKLSAQCGDPTVQYVTMFKCILNSGIVPEWMGSLPKEEWENDD